MKPIPIKTLSIDGLMARLERNAEIYNALSPEDKAEVDAFNKKIAECNGDIRAIIALGIHPMARHMPSE